MKRWTTHTPEYVQGWQDGLQGKFYAPLEDWDDQAVADYNEGYNAALDSLSPLTPPAKSCILDTDQKTSADE